MHDRSARAEFWVVILAIFARWAADPWNHKTALCDWWLYYVTAVVHVSESILSQLLSIVKDETLSTEVSQLAFQLLYHITKVIGIFCD